MKQTGPEEGAVTPVAQEKVLQGVGGWLAFLIVSMGILSPLMSLSFYFRSASFQEDGSVMHLLAVLAGCALFVAGAWRLYRRHVWSSVRFAIMALWAGSFALGALAYLFLFFVGGWQMVWAVLSGERGDLFRSLAYPVIWTLYLLRSRRVRNTYRRESEMEELARHLGVKRDAGTPANGKEEEK